MTDFDFSASEPITKVERNILSGGWPTEWQDTPTQINMRSDAPTWAKGIMEAARVQLALRLGKAHFDILLHPETWEKVEKNTKPFSMKTYAYPLTQTMREAGWQQWQSTVQTKSKQDALKEGVKFKRYRYAVHFWVSPDNYIHLGKLKLEGKHIPPPNPSPLRPDLGQ